MKSILVNTRYLNLPVIEFGPKCMLRFYRGTEMVYELRTRMTCGAPDFWVAVDLKRFKGQNLMLEIQDFIGESDPYEALLLSDERMSLKRIDMEDLRPRYHFSAICGWLNDPNGLMYYKGTYFLFCQINPYFRWCDNMHWMLATSKDLMHWEDQGLILYPDSTGQKYSGSGIVDEDNVTGLKDGQDAPLLLFYTAAGSVFTQDLAYSTDGGRTWKLYENNPVLPEIVPGNRDPKVIRRQNGKGWWMALYLEKNDYALLSSNDLLHWEKTCVLTLPGCLECPDIYEIKLDGDSQKPYIVFSCAGGQYLVGDIENNQFIAKTPLQRCYEGQDVYAPQSFYGMPDGRRVQIICSSNKTMLPGEGFGKFLTLPCELTLRSLPRGIKLFSRPAEEVKILEVSAPVFKGDLRLNAVEPYLFTQPQSGLYRLCFTLDNAFAGKLILRIYDLEFHYDGANRTVSYEEETAALTTGYNEIRIELLVDRCSAELFVDDGQIYWPAVKPLDHSLPPLQLMSSSPVILHDLRLCELSALLPWKRADTPDH